MLALVLVLTLGVSAFAETTSAASDTEVVTITNPAYGTTIEACANQKIRVTVDGPSNSTSAKVYVDGSAYGDHTATLVSKTSANNKVSYTYDLTFKNNTSDKKTYTVVFKFYDANGKYLSDADCVVTFTITGHQSFSQADIVPAQAATCGTKGHQAYVQCKKCGKYFKVEKNANGNWTYSEISKADLEIPATGNHTWKEVGKNSQGQMVYKCSVCGALKTGAVTTTKATKGSFVYGEQGWAYVLTDGTLPTGKDIVEGTIDGVHGWYYIEDGVFKKKTSIEQNVHGWWRIVNGKVDFSYNGIAQNQYGWWKCTNGKVTFRETGVYQNEHGWWYCYNSRVRFDYNGLASNQYGNWVIENGKVTFQYNGKYTWKGYTYNVKNSKVV